MFSWQGGIAADERFDRATDEFLEKVELPVGAGARKKSGFVAITCARAHWHPLPFPGTDQLPHDS